MQDEGLFNVLTESVFEKAANVTPVLMLASLETVLSCLQLAHTLEAECVFEKFEKEGCLDALE